MVAGCSMRHRMYDLKPAWPWPSNLLSHGSNMADKMENPTQMNTDNDHQELRDGLRVSTGTGKTYNILRDTGKTDNILHQYARWFGGEQIGSMPRNEKKTRGRHTVHSEWEKEDGSLSVKPGPELCNLDNVENTNIPGTLESCCLHVS